MNTTGIILNNIQKDLFDGVAERVAKDLAANRQSNKPTQLRRFYDEICQWTEKVDGKDETYKTLSPFIHMLNAKTAYAFGRNKLVDANFVELIRYCLNQVNNAETLGNFKLFMEAVMGFYKYERPGN
ncbi:MAG: type III-A CRISPR-associated protein Csm2 [Magnetococcales bacterium]|nr:type III-A CRISPR-associated protein Csm2 [Magnetococcales bacterium]